MFIWGSVLAAEVRQFYAEVISGFFDKGKGRVNNWGNVKKVILSGSGVAFAVHSVDEDEVQSEYKRNLPEFVIRVERAVLTLTPIKLKCI